MATVPPSVKPRCVRLFDESIKSKYTKKNYHSHLRQFMEFTGAASEDALLTIPSGRLQCLLEDYLLELRRTANPNSVPSKFQGIRHFCIMNRIRLDWEIIRKMFPQKQKAPDMRSYTTLEVDDMLRHASDLRNRALIHFLASTGARIGVFDHRLEIQHTREMPDSCAAVRLYAGELEEYWGFLTPQASGALHTYHESRRASGETFSEDTPVFATGGKVPRQLGWSGARSVMYRTVSKSDITRHKHDRRYDVQIDHGLRKRFNTILKLDNSVNHNVAEKLMGHKNGLDGVYLTSTVDELFAEFRKVIRKIEIPNLRHAHGGDDKQIVKKTSAGLA